MGKDVLMDGVQQVGKELRHDGLFFRFQSEDDLGWASLSRGDWEILRPGGAWVFQTADGAKAWKFPDRTNISHDETSGWFGAVSDGRHLVRFTPDRRRAAIGVYLGSNAEGEVVVEIFLASGVKATRTAEGEVTLTAADGQTLHLRPIESAKNVPLPRLEVGDRTHPDGKTGPAVIVTIQGFAANALEITADAPDWTPPPVERVRFDVRSSADPQAGEKQPQGPIAGVLNPLYDPDVQADFGMVFSWKGQEPFVGSAEFEIVNALGGVDHYEKQPVGPVEPGSSDVRVAFQPKFPRPGVADAWARLRDAKGNLLWVGRYRLAYDWPAYRPRIVVEPDFAEFWEQTLDQLRSIPLDARAERVPEYEDAPDFEIYRVRFTSWNHQVIHALLYVPRVGQPPFPAVVTAHPGKKGFELNKGPDGVYGSKIRHDPRFVTISPLVRGHEPDAPDIPFNHPWWGPLGDRDTYVARAWYCAMVRAVDYLISRPDLVDPRRIMAYGGSQGGALAIVTAALDPRIAVCLADCPANAQAQEIMADYASFGPSFGQVPEGRSRADVIRALSYYNPVNFAPRISCPTYVGSNIGDLTVHSLGPLAIYHNLTGLGADQKAFFPGFTHFHGSGPGFGKKVKETHDALANGAVPVNP